MTDVAAVCPLCGSTDARLLAIGYDRMSARETDYPYVRCSSCGLVRQTPLPQPADILGLYPADYDAYVRSHDRNLGKLVNRLAITYLYGVDSVSRPRLLRAIVRALSSRIMRGIREPHGANRLLDVGCGSGQQLEVYRALGWRVSGIEINPRACAACRAQGLEVHEGTVFDAHLDGRQFDMILLSHVIEHVLDPVAVLRRVAACLAPNGKIVVSTPNVRGVGFALYGSCWFHLDAPRHLLLFDPRTLRLLATRAGLSVAQLVTPSNPQGLCESRHYARTQGRELPRGLARRQALLEASAHRAKPGKLYRDCIAPFAYIFSLLGMGDVLQAELRLDPTVL